MTTIPFPIPIPSPDSPRRRGAPLGNHNARKNRLPDKDLLWEVVHALQDTKGCAGEIAMLRLRIQAMFARHVPDEELFHACEVLNRLLQTHYKIMLAEAEPPDEN